MKLESSLSLSSSLHSWNNQCKPMTKLFVILWKTELGVRLYYYEQAFSPYKCLAVLLKVAWCSHGNLLLSGTIPCMEGSVAPLIPAH